MNKHHYKHTTIGLDCVFRFYQLLHTQLKCEHIDRAGTSVGPMYYSVTESTKHTRASGNHHNWSGGSPIFGDASS